MVYWSGGEVNEKWINLNDGELVFKNWWLIIVKNVVKGY